MGYHEVGHEADCLPLGREPRITIKVPDVELDHLPGAPLKVAIAQVRFAPVFAIERRSDVAAFQERLGDRYVALEATSSESQFSTRGAATPQPPGPDPEVVWRFERLERDWTISLSSTSLALEAVHYLDFDDFAGELSTIVEGLNEVFKPQREVRLGLRYVNHIDDKRLQKDGIRYFLNERLISPVGADLGDDLLGSLAELRFREQEGTLVIRHGLIEPARYLIDFDRFNAEERDFDHGSVVERIKGFHRLIEPLFVWSISDRYLKELQGATR